MAMSGNLLLSLTICLVSILCHAMDYVHDGDGFCQTSSDDIGAGFAWCFSLEICKRQCDRVPVCKAISYDGRYNCFVVHQYAKINTNATVVASGWKCYRNEGDNFNTISIGFITCFHNVTYICLVICYI